MNQWKNNCPHCNKIITPPNTDKNILVASKSLGIVNKKNLINPFRISNDPIYSPILEKKMIKLTNKINK